MRNGLLTLTALLAWAAGCEPSGRTAAPFAAPGEASLYERLQADDPAVRVEAVVDASRSGDAKALPYLVDRLGDSELEVRFAAIHALKRQAGTTFGYEPYAATVRRAAAMRRWRQWLAERTGAASQPAGAASRPAGGGGGT